MKLAQHAEHNRDAHVQQNHGRRVVAGGFGRPAQQEAPQPPATLKICNFCLSEIHRGMPHNCSEEQRRINAEKMLLESTEKVRQRVVGSQLKDLAVASGSKERGGEVELSTGGRPLRASFGDSKLWRIPQKYVAHFSHEELNTLESTINASGNHMKFITNYLRIKCGRKSVEPYHKEFMQARNKTFQHLFQHTRINQEVSYSEKTVVAGEVRLKKTKKTKQVLKTLVYCNDVLELTKHIILHRDLDPDNILISIGIGEIYLIDFLHLYF